jgi:transposase
MKETLEEFYNHLLDIESPWEVASIKRDASTREVTAIVQYKPAEKLKCPECGKEGSLHDHRTRRWRHLDSCNHKTLIEAEIPRVKCSEHGIKQVPVNWAEKNSRFTLEFESAVILWLKEDSIKTVALNFGISWDEVNGIMGRALKRGLQRRQETQLTMIGIDETSFQKRHEYVTVILDKDRDVVIDILDDRKSETLSEWFKTQKTCDFTRLSSITMDMWDPFIKAVQSAFENAGEIISFDRYHVSQYFCKAVDKVRSEENKMFLSCAYNPLKHTKYQWLKNSERTDNRATKRKEFMPLTQMNLKTARAWRIKEAASMLWDYTNMNIAEKNWNKLLRWISLCRLKPVIKVGKMIRNYYWGILNAIRHKVNNGMLESKNSFIQKIKNRACGFRNRKRFKNAILFHLGGLDLLPAIPR